MGDPRFGKAVPCPKCNAGQPSSGGVPELFRECSFESFELSRNPEMEDALSYSRMLVDGTVSLVFLYGPPGRGKTHLAAAAVNAAPSHGRASYFWNVAELLAYLRSQFGENAGAAAENYIRSLAQSEQVLALDDLGAHKGTDWTHEVLYRIVNGRIENRVPTILTSNVAMEALDQRLRSRVRAGLVYCEGRDVR